MTSTASESGGTANALMGAGGTTGAALTAIGSDLSVSLTYSVAAELLDAAREEQISEDELVGVVLGMAVVFSALRKLLSDAVLKRQGRLRRAAKDEAEKMSKELGISDGDDGAEAVRFKERCAKDAMERASKEKSVLEFVLVLVSIAVRIAFGISVQLLAASARARQTSRASRVISLLSLSVYFLWIESGSDSRAF